MTKPNSLVIGEAFIDDYLAHYASKYYDPAKAREYYLKNRELKGRRNTKGFGEEAKEARGYTKGKISSEKRASLEGTAENQKTELGGLRKTAAFKRKVLSEKISRLRGEVDLDRKEARAIGLESRRELASNLKGLVDNAREKYTQVREKIKADYEAKYQAEYDAIKANF